MTKAGASVGTRPAYGNTTLAAIEVGVSLTTPEARPSILLGVDVRGRYWSLGYDERDSAQYAASSRSALISVSFCGRITSSSLGA